MSGWIALRYLHDPATARAHLPISTTDRSIRLCWHERTIGEAAPPRRSETTTPCARAMRPPHATPPPITDSLRAPDSVLKGLNCARHCRLIRPAVLCLSDEIARATDMLYAVGERDVVVSFRWTRGTDAVTSQRWPRSVSLPLTTTMRAACWRSGRQRSPAALRLTITLPLQKGSRSTARLTRNRTQRDLFGSAHRKRLRPADKSSANAVGLMQVTPEAGHDTAKRFGVAYIGTGWFRSRLQHANGCGRTQRATKEYAGSHIMTFAGYNAGRGRFGNG